MRTTTTLAFACALGLALPVRGQDVEGSKDHPMFSRLPGYQIASYDAQDFGAFDFSSDPAKHVEGKLWQISYTLKEGGKKAGPLQIARNYTDLIVKQGGKKLWEQVSINGGTTIAQLPVAGHSLWLQLDINNDGEQFILTVVEEAAMEQIVEFTASQLATELRNKGSVSLHNILFDIGKATIKTESGAAISPIGDLLKGDETLKLEIQGHTDNVGAAASNLKLSQDRAAAVKAYLVQNFGIAADRLSTAGFGDTKPAGDNKTDAGRAMNRRVELVKR